MGGLGGGLGSGEFADLLKDLKLDGGKGAEEKEVDNRWWKSATETAETEGVRGIRVTRVVQNPSSAIAKVEDYMLAMIEPGVWKPVISVSATANNKDVDPADVARLKADPRIKNALKMVEKFGLGGAGIVDKALRQGAATEMAMNACHEKFFEQLDVYSQRSDGPPLVVK